MTRMAMLVAAVVVLTTSSVSRAQSCTCCAGPCDIDLEPTPEALAEMAELRGVFAGSVALASLAYVFSTAYAQTQPHAQFAVDSIPVVGAIAAAVRNDGQQNMPVLLFAAGVQVIGTLWAIAAGTELAEATHRFELGFGVSGCGAGVSLTLPLQ